MSRLISDSQIRNAGSAEAPSSWHGRLGRLLWRAPDPDLVDAGQRGEWLIASIRLLIVVLAVYPPLSQYTGTTDDRSTRIVLFMVAAALAEALVIYSAVMRSWGRGWIGFFSGILDVSLVTAALFVYLRLERPLEAITDLVIFPIYFLAIGATSLRYDFRVSLLVGFTAIIQYASLVYYTVWQWDLDDPGLRPALAAEFVWLPQIGRLTLLAMATLLATSLILRAQEQRSLSNRDRLTNLSNRGFFDESMSRIGALASRSGEPVAVAMIDVDHFKRFNDTYGHQSGDAALQEVARVLSESFRTTDLVARYGGEEFAGLFPGMSLEDSVRRLEQLRRSIASLPIKITGGRAVHVTVSIGVAVWPKDGLNLSEVLSLADMRLYQAKSSGRNRVVAAPAQLPRGGGGQAVSPASSAPSRPVATDRGDGAVPETHAIRGRGAPPPGSAHGPTAPAPPTPDRRGGHPEPPER
ncbi:MAG: GGDEF domain-containing protein [Holophagales bacterium]|nr:GGDEF domain-containing protein [Holophagales bacterium]